MSERGERNSESISVKRYYDILGVPVDASEREIVDAYRKIAKQVHTDRNAGDAQAETRMKEASDAYVKVLGKDPTLELDIFGEDDEARANLEISKRKLGKTINRILSERRDENK